MVNRLLQRLGYLILSGLLALGAFVGTVWALQPVTFLDTWVVTNNNDAGPGSLRAVLAVVRAGDVVTFAPSVSGTIALIGGEIIITQPVTIQGPGSVVLTVSGENSSRVFSATSPLTITSLTIANGFTNGNGAGLWAGRTLLLSDTHFLSNTGRIGGGLYVRESAVLTDTQFLHNTAVVDGGGLYAAGLITVNSSLFQNNRAAISEGGGAFLEEEATLSNSRFISNTADSYGGGLLAVKPITLNETQFISNTIQRNGGGVYTRDRVTVEGGIFLGNQAEDGGGLYSFGSAKLLNTQLIDNIAEASVGGAVIVGPAIVSGTLFQGNEAVTGEAGGLWAFEGVVMTNTQFISNTADGVGGGAIVILTATISSSLFQNNQADRAGGICLDRGIITSTRFIENVAYSAGGAIESLGVLTLTNLLFVNNDASRGAVIKTGSFTAIQHVTIAGMPVINGSAIFVRGDAEITNTIIASHTIGLENEEGTVYQDYNLLTGNTTNISGTVMGGTHNPIGPAHFVDPAQNNYRLGNGSAAIGTGLDIGVMTDLDGNPRPSGNGVDIGAYEAQGQPNVATEILLTAEPLTVTVGETSLITATVLDGDSIPVSGQVITLTVSAGILDTFVATTDNSGMVTAILTAGLTPGIAIVTASTQGFAGPITDTVEIVVTAEEPKFFLYLPMTVKSNGKNRIQPLKL